MTTTGISKQTLVGGGMGNTIKEEDNLLYIAQILAAPQYKLTTDNSSLALDYRYIVTARMRYKIGSVFVLDTGVYNDAQDMALFLDCLSKDDEIISERMTRLRALLKRLQY